MMVHTEINLELKVSFADVSVIMMTRKVDYAVFGNFFTLARVWLPTFAVIQFEPGRNLAH